MAFKTHNPSDKLNRAGHCYTIFSFFNANGIKSQIAELKHYILKHKIDIMLLNETHLRPCDKFYIPNYNIIRTDRLHNKGGGTAIIIRKHIDYTVIPNNYSDIEVTGITIKNHTGKNYNIFAIYNPPKKILNVNEFTNLIDNNAETIIAGDLNSKSTHWNCRQNNRNGQILNTIANTHNLNIIAPDSPTHFSTNGQPDILDLLITNNLNYFPVLTVQDELSSDHLPVNFTLYGLHNPSKVQGDIDYGVPVH